MTNLLIILVLFAVLWFLLIRPQRRRQQETERMLAALRVGDEIVTAGGIYGEITAMTEKDVWVEIAPDLTVKVARRAIAGVVGEDEEPPEVAEDTEPTASERG